MICLILESVDPPMDRDALRRGAGKDLTDTDLRYSAFIFRVTFHVGGTVIIGPRRAVALFDFLVGVANVLRDLRQGVPTSLGFPDSSDRIHFRCTDDRALVTAPDQRVAVWADYRELEGALAEFLADTRTVLFRKAPGLRQNPHVAQIYA
jgi:hypothetical protein